MGGDKIESLQKDIQHAQEKLNSVIQASSNYQKDCRELELDAELNEELFTANKRTATERLEKIADDTKRAQDNFGEAAAQFSQQQQSLERY